MFTSRCLSHVASFCAACVLMFSDQVALGTVLTFEMTPYPGNVVPGYESTFASYGDNVTATTMPGPGTTYNYGMGNGFTPEVAISYTHADLGTPGSQGHSLYGAEGGWSDPIDYLHYQDGDIFWFTFTPTAFYGVDVNSFAIDLYQSTATLNWKLRRDSTIGTIFASGTTGLSAAGADAVINIPNGSYHGVVVLEIDFSGTSNVGTIGFDDLNFDQLLPPVPEPSTFVLLGLGVVGLSIKSRRRRRGA